MPHIEVSVLILSVATISMYSIQLTNALQSAWLTNKAKGRCRGIYSIYISITDALGGNRCFSGTAICIGVNIGSDNGIVIMLEVKLEAELDKGRKW